MKLLITSEVIFVDVGHGVSGYQKHSRVAGAGRDQIGKGPQRCGAGHVGHQGGVGVLLGHHHIVLGPVAGPDLGPSLETEPGHDEEEQEDAGDRGDDDVDHIDTGIHLVHNGLLLEMIALLENNLLEKIFY